MGYYETRKGLCNDLKLLLKEHDGPVPAKAWTDFKTAAILTHGVSHKMISKVLVDLGLQETPEGVNKC